MKRLNTYGSGGDSEDEFVDSSPIDDENKHVKRRKERRGVIEKRRRDRINHCLMELRRLVPQAISKEGSTKLEKAEILQMTVDHLRALQQMNTDSNNSCPSWPMFDAHASGFRECIDEISRYLISVEGFDAQHPLRLRLLSHLECFTERSISPSSSSSSHQPWPILQPQAPSAFATPPLSSYSSSSTSSSSIGYHPPHPHHHHHHHSIPPHHHQTDSNFHMHHYQRPPIESSCQLPSTSTSSCI